MLLDNKASLNIFSNMDLLTNVRKSDKTVRVSGIEQGGGVSVYREGNFGEFGTVYYSGASGLGNRDKIRSPGRLLYSAVEGEHEDVSIREEARRRQ